MKVIVKENLGAEYTSDLISSCNQSGIQAIADYTGNEILFYDPKNWLYGRHSDMMKDASLEDDIFSIFNGKTPELRAKVLKPAKGEDFREFAVEWNDLQKQESPDIIKTKNCSMIRLAAHESGMSRSSMKGEYTVKIEWQVDFPEFGINAGDTEKLVLRFSEIDALAHAHGGNGFEELIEEMMNEKYPGIGQLDYEDDYIITNFEEMCDYHDMYIGKERVYESSDSLWDIEDFLDYQEILKPRDREFVKSALRLRWGIEGVIDTDDPDWDEAWDDVHSELMLMYGNGHWHENCQYNEGDSKDMDDNVSEWYAERFPDDDLAGRINKKVTFQDVMDYIDYGADIHALLGTFNPLFKERLFAELAARTGIEHDKLYRKWLKNSAFYESIDNRNDWSASEDEVEIQWMIDDKELGIESGSTETVVIDLDLVDCFEELVYQVGLALEKAHGGMQFDYDDEWILVDEDKLLKRFGYNMNESETNGGTMEVTLIFTHGHYGKKLKSGDKRTIKVDLSTAPEELYDEDDFMSWIADVASDQVPGGGRLTKYDFEIPDEDADRLIKAVKGDEGFGPDVDIDLQDPDSIPSEISYGDALKIYKKMREAYDNHKMKYTDFDVMKKKVIGSVVNDLLKHNSLEDLADKWFKDYGTMNGWGWKTSFKYSIAYALHEIHKKKHPDEHEPLPQKNNWRGWHEDNCSCGFGSSSDSSD